MNDMEAAIEAARAAVAEQLDERLSNEEKLALMPGTHTFEVTVDAGGTPRVAWTGDGRPNLIIEGLYRWMRDCLARLRARRCAGRPVDVLADELADIVEAIDALLTNGESKPRAWGDHRGMAVMLAEFETQNVSWIGEQETLARAS